MTAVDRRLVTERLSNGLSVIIEEMPQVGSVAFELVIPSGVVSDPEGYEGASLLLAELSSRGAAGLNARELSDAFDSIGARHSESACSDRFEYRSSVLPERFPRALELVAAMVREPSFPEGELEGVRSLFLQDLNSLFDKPSSWVMKELAARFFPKPYDRCSLGTKEGLQACNREMLVSEWKRRFGPKGSILSIAGCCSATEVMAQIKSLFGGWAGETVALPEFGAWPTPVKFHVSTDTSQIQIGLAWLSVPFAHKHYYTAKVATGVLSGGMFGRLFTEVREKRGLVYSVYAQHIGDQRQGAVLAYAGTTPERAQETLDVMLKEIRGIRGTVQPDELERVKANIKASLVIGEESPGGRAGSNGHDWWLGERVRPLEEILNEVNRVDAAMIDEYVDAYPSTPFTCVTLGNAQIS